MVKPKFSCNPAPLGTGASPIDRDRPTAHRRGKWRSGQILASLLGFILVSLLAVQPAWAGLTDDRFDGNIFPLYAGNGSLVPPRENLAANLKNKRPTVLMFYIDDSFDCKQNAIVMSQLQAFYTRYLGLLPVTVDGLLPDLDYTPQEEGYYYNGVQIPQWVILQGDGTVALNKIGPATYEELDDVLREIYELPPRSSNFDLGNPANFSPSPSADSTFWTAPVRQLDE
ncbi:MAG: thylakoid membrane photosystem I accumulation factor [Prochlorothrix sp.]